MKNNIGTIAGKEFHRFFGDKRMLISLVMPALILFLMYSFLIPTLMTAVTSKAEPTKLYAVNMPEELKSAATSLGCDLIAETDADKSACLKKLDEDKDALLLVFPSDFTASVKSYDTASGKPAPNVEIYYNSSSETSGTVYKGLVTALDEYESSMSNKFDINRGVEYDLATDKDITGSVFSMIMPMLLMIFLFSGCMTFAPDSIAGEKERGTIATMLVTPINRYEIVVGKIIAFAVIAVISGGLTFLAVAASLPNLMSVDSSTGASAAGMTFTGYAASDYIALLFIIISTVLLMISAVSLLSAYAKTTKEAASMTLPIFILVMVVSFASFQSKGAATNSALYLIPFYNSVQSMVGVFSYAYSPTNILISVVSNLVYSAAVVFAVTRMFRSERAMFSKQPTLAPSYEGAQSVDKVPHRKKLDSVKLIR